MEPSQLPYDEWIREALRQVMARALRHVSAFGLPGNHHFYITFDTTYEGVDIPQDLHDRYPEEMTIVLQHQFWDLTVDDEEFSIGLKFRGVMRHLKIPLAAVTGFVDPSINFAIQLQTHPDTGAEPALDSLTPVLEPSNSATEADNSSADGELPKGDVITLDSFRKNKT